MGSDDLRVFWERTVTSDLTRENLLPSEKACGPNHIARELPNLLMTNLQCQHCRDGAADGC